MTTMTHILHLEDDPVDAELIQTKIESAGLACSITRVQTQNEFDHALRQNNYDLILADYRLPKYDGMSALQLAQEKRPEIPFVFVSETVGEEAAIEALTAGASDFIHKHKLSRLGSAIQRAFRKAQAPNERRQAAEMIPKHESLLCSAVDNIGMYAINPQMQVLEVNKQMRDWFPDCDPVQRPICYEVLNSPPRNNVCENCPAIMSIKDGLVHEAIVEKRQGSMVRADHIIASPLTGIIGEITTSIVMIDDVAERNRAEAVLKTSKARYFDYYENAPDMYLSVNAKTALVEQCNLTLTKVVGYTKEEIVGRSVYDICHPDCLEEVQKAFRTFLEKGELYDKELQLRKRDGSKLDVSLNVSAIRAVDETILFSRSTLRDITERKHAEKALKESETRVQRNLDAILSPDAVDIGALELADIIDSEKIQNLMNAFYRLTHIGVGIIDLHGKVLVGTGWQDVCTKFHRVNPESRKLCVESDLELSSGVPAGEFRLYRCKNNMWDIATPIMLGEKHVGNIFLGQFLFADETPDYEIFRQQARRYGFDQQEYIAALEQVPRWSRDTTDAAMSFYSILAGLIGNLSFSNVKLAGALEERNRAEEALKKSEALLNASQHLTKVGSWEFDIRSGKSFWSEELFRIHEIPHDPFIDHVQMSLNCYKPEDRSIIQAAFENVCQRGESYDLELPFITYMGKHLWVRTAAQPIFEKGKVVRVVGNLMDITDRKRNEQVNAARLHLVQYSLSHSLDELLEETLNEAERLTDSLIGFYHFVEEDQKTLTLQNWSTRTKDVFCQAEGKGLHYAIDQAGVWVDCVKQRKAVIHNDYAALPHRRGIPEGHAKVSRELVIPVFRGEKITAILGIGNKPTDYTEKDVELVSLIADLAWEIAERKRAEEAMRSSEERLLLAAEAAQMGLWDWNIITGDVIWSDQCKAHYGISCETSMSYELFLQALHPEDRDSVNAALKSAVEEGKNYNETKRTIWPDGSIHWTNSRGQVHHDSTGKPVRMIGVTFDITENKLAEARLLESEERFRGLVTQAVDAFYLLDHNGRILDVNQSACTSLGYDRKELLSFHIADVDVEVESNRHKERFWDTLQPAKPVTFEGLHRRKDGSTFPVEVRLGMLQLGNSKCILGLARDITDRKQTEEEHLAHLRFIENLDKVNRAIQAADDLEQMMDEVLDVVLSIFDCDRVRLVYPCDPQSTTWQIMMESTRPEYATDFNNPLPMNEERAEIIKRVLARQGPVQFGPEGDYPLSPVATEPFSIKSFMSIALHPNTGAPWKFTIHQCTTARSWTTEEARLFEEIGRRMTDSLNSLLAYRNLARSKAKLAAAQRLAKIGSWEFDLKNNQLTWSDEIERIFEIDPVEFGATYEAFLELVHPEDREAVDSAFTDSLSTRTNFTFDHRLLFADGRIKYIQAQCETYFDADGDPIRSVGTSQDITERKQMEKILGEKETRYQTVADFTYDWETWTDPKGKLLYCSPACERITGYQAEEFEHEPDLLTKMIQPEDRARMAVHFADELGKAAEFEEVEYRIHTRNGEERWIAHACRTVYDPDGVCLGRRASNRDITEKKLAEDRIRQLNLELEQRVSERTAELEAANKELEAFSYSVSHDLRAPLRHVDGFVRLLDGRLMDSNDELSKHYMKTISTSAKRMGTLIDDLLYFSRMGRKEMSKQQLDLESLVQDIIQELAPESAGRTINWHVASLPVVHGDFALLRAVLVNLISNALKFTRPRDCAEIEIGGQIQEGEAVFFVRDNGVGFNPAYADRLFNVFQRLHRTDEFEGSGIGLANVRRIIDRHGGRTWAKGSVDQGATFYFSLPALCQGAD